MGGYICCFVANNVAYNFLDSQATHTHTFRIFEVLYNLLLSFGVVCFSNFPIDDTYIYYCIVVVLLEPRSMRFICVYINLYCICRILQYLYIVYILRERVTCSAESYIVCSVL